jgi:hypothetical protein
MQKGTVPSSYGLFHEEGLTRKMTQSASSSIDYQKAIEAGERLLSKEGAGDSWYSSRLFL